MRWARLSFGLGLAAVEKLEGMLQGTGTQGEVVATPDASGR